MAGGLQEHQVEAIVGLCRSGLASEELRIQVMRQLRRVVPVDAAFLATVDPASLLFTSAAADEPLGSATPLFMDNEFGQGDVNKFAVLAASPDPVNSLDHATAGNRAASARYREIMAPLSLGDELRAALVVGGRCWGVMCLHREDSPDGFTDSELQLIRRLVPYLAAGLRNTVVVERAMSHPMSIGPGIVVLDENLATVSCNRQGEYWLDRLRGSPSERSEGLPVALHSIAVRLVAEQHGPDLPIEARVRVPTVDGEWLVLHASRLRGSSGPQTAVVIEAAGSDELGSLILDAHGLTPAQSRVAALVLQGRSTREIVNELAISANTVQEHLHAVFDKFGIGSRRELVAILLHRRPG